MNNFVNEEEYNDENVEENVNVIQSARYNNWNSYVPRFRGRWRGRGRGRGNNFRGNFRGYKNFRGRYRGRGSRGEFSRGTFNSQFVRGKMNKINENENEGEDLHNLASKLQQEN